MRKIAVLFIVIALAFTQSCAYFQAYDFQKTYQTIVNATGKSKDQLFNSGLVWASGAFKSEKTVIAISDREAGLITINTTTIFEDEDLGGSMDGAVFYIDFKVRIEVKAEKARITCSQPDFYQYTKRGERWEANAYENLAQAYIKAAREIIDSISENISKNSSDW